MTTTCNLYWGSVLVGTFPLETEGPTECDVRVYRGDSFALTIEFLDSTSAPIPLTGAWAAEERQDADATDPLATFTVDLANASAGRVTLRLDPTVTATLQGGVWDLQQTGTDGSVSTWLNGTVAVRGDVTR